MIVRWARTVTPTANVGNVVPFRPNGVILYLAKMIAALMPSWINVLLKHGKVCKSCAMTMSAMEHWTSVAFATVMVLLLVPVTAMATSWTAMVIAMVPLL